MDRRQFLWTGSAAALSLTFVPGRLLAQRASTSSDAALNAVFQRIFDEQVRTSPLSATFLGLDKGKLAALRSKLDTRPDQVARREEIARTNKFIGWLEKVPETGLSPAGKLNREVILWDLRTGNVGPERFDVSNPQSPYVISQQDGAYFFIPDVLNSAHPIDNAADANAYLARLEQFATVLDNETAEQQRQAARGFLAPGWSLDLALKQMRELRAPAPDQSTMADSVARRTAAKKIAGDWRARAAKIVADKVYPALDRQIAAVTALRPTTRAGDGLWRVPGGAEVYAAALAEATIMLDAPSVTPEEFPAWTLPLFLKTGGNFAIDSVVASKRGCSSRSKMTSPFLPATVTGAISALNQPSSHAFFARACDSTAY
jgi:uncharacterized protein (DUF885 family)